MRSEERKAHLIGSRIANRAAAARLIKDVGFSNRFHKHSNGDPHGCRIPLGTIGACGLNGWWPDIRRFELAE